MTGESNNTYFMRGCSTFIVFGIPFSGTQFLLRPIGKSQTIRSFVLFDMEGMAFLWKSLCLYCSFSIGDCQRCQHTALSIRDSSGMIDMLVTWSDNKAVCNNVSKTKNSALALDLIQNWQPFKLPSNWVGSVFPVVVYTTITSQRSPLSTACP